ncbi:MAG: hypothetical protein ACHQF4_10205, partial [Sphingobacteriales bacterium]
QKVQPEEVASWITNNLSPENQAQVQLGNAKQNVINYQHVVRVPIGVNAALFFTKDNGKLQVYAYKWLDKKPGEKLFTGYITEYSFQTGTAAEFSYQDSKITKRSGLMVGAPQGLSPAKNRMKITGGTTRSGDISSIFSRFWCWLTGGTYISASDIAGGNYGASGDVQEPGCDYSSIQQNPEGGGDPSGNYQLNIDDSFAPTPPSVDFTVPPPDPSTGWVSVYTPPDPGCGFDANGDQVLTNDGSCTGTWTTFQVPTFIVNVTATSVLNNKYTACVYNNLQGNTEYQSLIKGFLFSNAYNLVLQVGTVNSAATGETSYDAAKSTQVTTTFDINQVSNLPIAQLAETFLHEAYHAYIDLILMQNAGAGPSIFSSTYASSFDQNIAYEVNLAELPYSASGTLTNAVIQQITHDVIAKDIAKLGAGLQQFIETIYPAIKNDPLITPTVYQNYIWSGLTDSQTFAKMWGAPSTWGGLLLPPDVNTAFGLLNVVPSPCPH